MSSPKNCGSTAERTARALLGVLCCWRIHNIGKIGEVVDRPKALGDIRGVSYIYGLFYRFGLIDVPDKVKEKMAKQ